MANLLNPVVKVVKLHGLTQTELKRLMTKIKSKKFGAKEYAIDVTEVDDSPERRAFHVKHRIMPMPAGPYFNVYLEYY